MASVAQDLSIRWAIRRDQPSILRIEHLVAEYPWGEEELEKALQFQKNIGLVAELEGKVVGYLVYQLNEIYLELLVMGVDPKHQRRGIGRLLVERAKTKLTHGRRFLNVEGLQETNLVAQQFFRALGFKAIAVERNYFAATGEDAYMMRYTPEDEACRGI